MDANEMNSRFASLDRQIAALDAKLAIAKLLIAKLQTDPIDASRVMVTYPADKDPLKGDRYAQAIVDGFRK